MPREVISDQVGLYDVVVGWEAGEYVQVGIRTRNREPVVTALAGEGDVAQFDSLWGTLSRSSLNQLVRVLRRARNAAYGADE